MPLRPTEMTPKAKVKILHNVHTWLPQTEIWAYTQIKYLPAGFETQVACRQTENLDQFGDIATIYCLRNRYSTIGYLLWRAFRATGFRRTGRWISEAIEEFKPNLIHSHFGNVGWEILPAIVDGTPHLVTFYGQDLSKLPKSQPKWKDRYKELFSRASGVLCEGEHMASCIEALGCDPAKIYVQRLGVQIDQIAYRPRMWNGRGPLRVLLAGTFTEKKGFPYAFSALGKLARALPVDITVIGDAPKFKDGRAEKQRMLKAIGDAGIEENVKFLGYQSHDAFFEQAYRHHVFLSPSVTATTGDTEGGAPVAIIEMTASGMPVISTRHCDIPGVIVDGKSGLLAEERDVDGLYDRLLWLASNTGRWKDMLDLGRAHVELNFDARRQGGKLAGIYLKTIGLKAL